MIDVKVAAPLCSPTRASLTGLVARQLAPYHFQHGHITAEHLTESGKPTAWQITVPFSERSAAWGEYVLLRYGYQRIGKFVNPKNEAWAQQYTGGPLYEESCHLRPKPKPGEAPRHRVPFGLRGEGNGNANPPPPWSVGGRERTPVEARPQRQDQRRKRRGILARLFGL